MAKQYKVGIYCRLSVDDASNSAKAKGYIPSDESVSIENQYEILSKFVMLNGWIEVKTYQDDGYSGGNFQRPGFLEMLEDARHGLINLILVKDLSRLGRDFVEVGRYTDIIFPSLGCRFVSVLDCLDSEGDNTDMLHFRSLMNDYHLKDLSSKVKSVLHAKKKSGQYLAAYAPYGYRKSEEDRHKLVIDGESAAVVRQIFQMRQSGMAYGKIAAALNEKGILPPRWYWAVHYGNGSCKYSRLWAYATVRSLLNDDIYVGTLTQNCTGSRSYKDKTMIRKPESEWISHEAHTRRLSGRSCGRLFRKSIRRQNRFPLTIRRPKHLCLPESWSARTAGILWLPPAKHSAGKMALSSTILLISAPGLPLPDIAFAHGTGFLRSA